MASKWPLMTLREANVTLIDCDHRTPPAVEHGYPYVAIPQLHDGRIDISGARRITVENFAEWTRKAKPIPHDVVLSRRCNPGETAFVPPDLDFALGQNLVLLRADGTKVWPPFLRWVVRGPEWWEQIDSFRNVGAVFDSLKCADIPNFHTAGVSGSIPLPPISNPCGPQPAQDPCAATHCRRRRRPRGGVFFWWNSWMALRHALRPRRCRVIRMRWPSGCPDRSLPNALANRLFRRNRSGTPTMLSSMGSETAGDRHRGLQG